VFQSQIGTLAVTAGTSSTFTLTSMFNSRGDQLNAQGSNVTFALPFGSQSYSLDQTQTQGARRASDRRRVVWTHDIGQGRGNPWLPRPLFFEGPRATCA
jgi:hypothetical protein